VADVAVVAHAGKTLGGGLPELREILAREGVTDPHWYEVKKSRRAPKYARRAAAHGADVLFVWGGDGSVQRCIDAVAGTDTAVAILPAGTANLLAANLGVPDDLAEAVQVGLHGDRRRLDTGSVNGERFMVMAGAGFDARMISEADRGAKDRLGRAAYIVTGVRNLAARRARTTVKVDGKAFFKGKASCVLAANVGQILGGVEAFPQAQPDDGRLELGVVTARNPVEWARTFGRLAVGHPDQSPFVKVTQGKQISIRFDRKIRYELDGGARPATRKLRIKVRPASVTICVPPVRLQAPRHLADAFYESAPAFLLTNARDLLYRFLRHWLCFLGFASAPAVRPRCCPRGDFCRRCSWARPSFSRPSTFLSCATASWSPSFSRRGWAEESPRPGWRTSSHGSPPGRSPGHGRCGWRLSRSGWASSSCPSLSFSSAPAPSSLSA
jgi:diacylglycerol kinase (ATP)